MRKTYYVTGFILAMTGALIAATQSCKSKTSQSNGNTDTQLFTFKEKLSDYHFFEGKLSGLQPRAGVVPYLLSTTLFSDYAVKDRFIVVPQGKKIKYTSSGVLDFPDSTIIIKNFAYTNTAHQKTMIETRLLVKDPSGKGWKVMDYLWNKEQTDAVKHITGAHIPITLLDDNGNAITTNYQVPNTNDCKRCHIKNDELIPIGPKARNLNFVLHGDTMNQLSRWASVGILDGLPDMAKVPQLPDWKDSLHFSLEQRARAYLDINCAHCHTQGGDAYNTGLFLEYQQQNPNHIGIMKSPVSAGNGAGGLDYDIIPGNATHSIMPYRMNSTEANVAMPELARSVVHKEGVKLIMEWINHMEGKKK